MQILHVADLHCEPTWFDWVANHCIEYDFLVIAGDLHNAFSNLGFDEQTRAISKWLVALRVPTAVCTGNHEILCSEPRIGGGWMRNLRHQGKIRGIDGDVFQFQDPNRGNRSFVFAVNGWLSVPELAARIDFLVTHNPPSGCQSASGAEGRDVGDPDLWDAVQSFPPRIIFAGHIHDPRKHCCTWPAFDPKSLILVPGVREHEIPAHWVVDTDTRTALHSSGEKVYWGNDSPE